MSVAFLDADQVASQLGISKAYAYKIIKVQEFQTI